jgi:hypothetical protein
MYEIVVMDTKRSRKTQTYVEECVRQKACLCGKCGSPVWKRGLSRHCYYLWMINRAEHRSAVARAKYDSELMKRGRLLAPQEVRRLQRCDVFTEVAKETES